MAEQLWLFDAEVLRRKLMDLETAGVVMAFDPDEADAAGAFEEQALEGQQAFESLVELEAPGTDSDGSGS